MSLLADILNNIKPARHKGSIPPGLAATVATIKKKSADSKRRYTLLGSGAALAAIVLVVLYYIVLPPKAVQNEPRPPALEKAMPAKKTLVKPESTQPASQEAAVALPSSLKQSVLDLAKKVIPEGVSGTPDDVASLKIEDTDKSRPAPTPSGAPAPPAPASQPRVHTEEKPSYEYYLYSANSSEQDGRLSEALKWYKKAAEVHPWDYRLQNKIAHILIRINMLAEASEHLSRALELKSDYVPALVNQGVIYARLGQFDKAEASLRFALDQEATNRNALYNMMLLYKKTGNQPLELKCREMLHAVGSPSRE